MKSIVVDVRKAVIAGIKTALSDPKVSVTYGWQGGDDTRYREQVFTNGGRATHDPAALKAGRNFRNERMDFDIVVLVYGVGKKPEDADDRVMEIGQVIEEYIADRKSNELGITGLNWLRVKEFELSPPRINANGTIAEAVYTVTYDARLT